MKNCGDTTLFWWVLGENIGILYSYFFVCYFRHRACFCLWGPAGIGVWGLLGPDIGFGILEYRLIINSGNENEDGLGLAISYVVVVVVVGMSPFIVIIAL